MYRNKKIAVIVPAYNEENLIKVTLDSMPDYIDDIIAINDCSKDGTLVIMRECVELDSRIVVINHEVNQGVGGAIKSGLSRFMNSDSDIMVIMAGDNQMDPRYLPSIIDPLILDKADIVKGNRLGRDLSQGMSLWRLTGNILLTYLTKISTGYYHVNDPQNGYVGATKEAIGSMDFQSLYDGYVFENDFMVKANIAGLRMINANIPAKYDKEKSGIKYLPFIVKTSLFLSKSFLFRIRYKYLNNKPNPSVNKKPNPSSTKATTDENQ